jgi:hypothetical protein
MPTQLPSCLQPGSFPWHLSDNTSPLQDSSQRQSTASLEEKILLAADLVAEDATRQSSPRALARTCGFIGTPDRNSTSAPYADEGEGYVLIRKAFSDAFHDVVQQVSLLCTGQMGIRF